MSARLSRRPRRQDPDGAGAYGPGWDLIPIPATLWSICRGGCGPLCAWRDPLAALGRVKYRSHQGNQGWGITVTWQEMVAWSSERGAPGM